MIEWLCRCECVGGGLCVWGVCGVCGSVWECVGMCGVRTLSRGDRLSCG